MTQLLIQLPDGNTFQISHYILFSLSDTEVKGIIQDMKDIPINKFELYYNEMLMCDCIMAMYNIPDGGSVTLRFTTSDPAEIESLLIKANTVKPEPTPEPTE